MCRSILICFLLFALMIPICASGNQADGNFL